MTSPDDELARALRALRAEYLAEAGAKVDELWTALARVQNGERDALEQLRLRVHRLAGSGGGYGFPDVTETGQAADQLCRRLLENPAAVRPDDIVFLQAAVQRIADAFARAQALE